MHLLLDLAEALKTLDERELRVVGLRFGLFDCDPVSRREIGEEFNVRHWSIKTIERRAVEKLRYRLTAPRFNDYGFENVLESADTLIRWV